MPYLDSRVDIPLSSVSFKLESTGEIADKVLTPLAVNEWSGILGSYGDQHLQLISSRVLDDGGYRTVLTHEYKLSDRYNVTNHGFNARVTERMREETKPPFQARVDVTKGLTSLFKVEKEYEAAQLLRNTGSYDSGSVVVLTSATKFSNYATSDPIDVFVKALKTTRALGKRKVTHAIIPYDVFEVLRGHPKYSGIYGQSGVLRRLIGNELSVAIGIKNILIPESTYVTSAGVETDQWGTDIVLYADQPAGLNIRTFGLNLTRKGHKFRVFAKDDNNSVRTEKIFLDGAYSYQISKKECGYLIRNSI